MCKIAIFTFIQKGEDLPVGFLKLRNLLGDKYNVLLYIIGDEFANQFSSKVNEVFVLPDTTKYHRIAVALNAIDTDYLLCIDSDISIQEDALRRLVDTTTKGNFDLSWGKIYAHKRKSFIARIVEIDKFLSHNILRPFLWRIKAAVTIPGQVFFIRKDTMLDAFNYQDTFLDDIAVGMFMRSNMSLKKYESSEVVGLEEPTLSIRGLFKQRKRWALGYASMIRESTGSDAFKYVLLHGFVYHGLWLILFLFLSFVNLQNAVIVFVILAFIISGYKLILIPQTILYLLVMPFYHIWWGFNVVRAIL